MIPFCKSVYIAFPPGYSSKITEQQLKGTDIDSDNLKLKFTVTKDLSVGTLQLHKGRNKVQISATGLVRSFTQDDINKGLSLFFKQYMSYSITTGTMSKM